jgi:hypothetical protein
MLIKVRIIDKISQNNNNNNSKRSSPGHNFLIRQNSTPNKQQRQLIGMNKFYLFFLFLLIS